MAIDESDTEFLDSLTIDLTQQTDQIRSRAQRETIAGPNDRQSAIITIQAGTGGTEAQNWAQTLLGMYTAWAKLQQADAEVINVSYGDTAGIRQATIRVEHPLGYGLLQSEHGVHRLSRVSDFDPAGRRHTSFARVTVIPALPAHQPAPEPPRAELKVEAFRASGPGGQHLQKSSTAIRLTHLPTGLTASAQSQRSQRQNRQAAMSLLIARIRERETQLAHQRQQNLQSNLAQPSWSHQIRSYILNPRQLIKDHRTGHTEHDSDAVFAGHIQSFIDAHIRSRTIPPTGATLRTANSA